MTVLTRGGGPPDPPVRGAPPPGAPLPSAWAGQPAVAAGTAGVAAKPPRAGTILTALETVRDPELDEPITSLGFVASCTVSTDGDAQVRLRLPTYFCAPNFAFLMVADAYDAVSAMPGVRTAEIVLEDHFASEAINGGVAARAGFANSFDGEAVGELDELRADFLRKAVMAGTDQVCRPLLAAGTDPASLPALTLGEVPPSRALRRLCERRAELGLPAADDAPLLIDPKTGEPVSPDSLRLHLGRARLTRTSLEANGSICRGMLRHRYDSAGLNSQPRGEEEQ
jgi:metal-sulfur cluster biosynthetic enzyme